MEKCWLRVSEAASYISINHKSMYALLARGEIPHSRRTGVGIRVHIDRLDEFLREGEVASVEQQIGERG
jgi:excisionase family DNA binding protein